MVNVSHWKMSCPYGCSTEPFQEGRPFSGGLMNLSSLLSKQAVNFTKRREVTPWPASMSRTTVWHVYPAWKVVFSIKDTSWAWANQMAVKLGGHYRMTFWRQVDTCVVQDPDYCAFQHIDGDIWDVLILHKCLQCKKRLNFECLFCKRPPAPGTCMMLH